MTAGWDTVSSIRMLAYSSRCRHGVSFVELLIAVGIMGVALMPVVSMANHNVEMLRAERSRLLAESLCHDILERLGRSQSYPANILAASTNPKVFSATDPWVSHPDLFDAMGYPQMEALAAQAKMHLTVSLERGAAPELDLLICEISWSSEGFKTRTERFRYSRFLTYGHMPQPR